MLVKKIRSSDDSTTSYIGRIYMETLTCIETHRRALGAVTINFSDARTFFYKLGYAEYTSLYKDKGFVSQFGTEISALRPQGKKSTR